MLNRLFNYFYRKVKDPRNDNYLALKKISYATEDWSTAISVMREIRMLDTMNHGNVSLRFTFFKICFTYFNLYLKLLLFSYKFSNYGIKYYSHFWILCTKIYKILRVF